MKKLFRTAAAIAALGLMFALGSCSNPISDSSGDPTTENGGGG